MRQHSPQVRTHPNMSMLRRAYFSQAIRGYRVASAFPRYAIFEPRVGLAWDPTGSGRQTIRAGFGLFYDTMETAYQEDHDRQMLRGPVPLICPARLEA